jgi:hypothetical protein
MACTNMTWDQVLDDLDLIRLKAINTYWAEHPPAHILIASYLGIKPKTQNQTTTSVNDDNVTELVNGVGGMVTGRPNDPMLDLLDLPLGQSLPQSDENINDE